LKEVDDQKTKELSKLVSTFFRNALRSNLDLTSLADTKAGILISINGFILTVSVTASGFAIHNSIMTYAFISIILTSLGSIIFAVLAVKPRTKDKLVKKEYLDGYESLLYYQDMADLSPDEYKKEVNKVIYKTKKSRDELISHLHILGSEIKKKYFWLKQAYTFFSIGLVISASLIIYGLVYVEQTAFYNLSKGNVEYKKGKFYNVFEPSGATTMLDNKILVVEDEGGSKSLKLLEIENDGHMVEVGNLYMPKKIKKFFRKEVEDLEAITSIEDTVYAITSHTLNKSSHRKVAREQFIMFKYDEAGVKEFYHYSNLKQDLFNAFPNIFKTTFFSSDSINIEGLTITPKGSLYIGFRSPMHNFKAMIIEILNPKEIFLNDEKPKFSKPIFLNLNGLAIRDITYDKMKKGYWVLAGASTSRDVSFELWFVQEDTFRAMHIKNQPDIGFAEGITLIQRDNSLTDLFIVQDNGKKPNKSADYVIINRDSL